MIGNLIFTTIALVAQAIIIPKVYTELETNYYHLITMCICNILVAISFHMVVMAAGRLYLSFKSKVVAQAALLDRTQEGVIIISEDISTVKYANLLARKFLEKGCSMPEEKFDVTAVDLSKIVLVRIDTDEKILPARNEYEISSEQSCVVSL